MAVLALLTKHVLQKTVVTRLSLTTIGIFSIYAQKLQLELQRECCGMDEYA